MGHKVPQDRERGVPGWWLGGAGMEDGSVLLPGVSVLERALRRGGCRIKLGRVLAVLSLILERSGDRGSDASYNVGRQTLSKIVGQEDSRHVLRWLKDADFIDPNRKWSKGKYCQGYKLTEYAAGLPLERVTLPPPIASKLKSFKQAQLNYALSRHSAHRQLWQSLQTLSLHPTSAQLKPSQDGDREKRAQRLFHWDQSVRQIHQREWRFSCDRRAGRIHSNISSLPSALRPYILLDGQACAEVDVKCCQPLLLYRFYPSGSVEAVRFGELVMSGRFYEEIAVAAQHNWTDRNTLKEKVFSQVLYGPVMPYFSLWVGFCRLFPELAALIKREKAGDYRRLAVSNQKAEADIIIRKVIPRLACELPGVPVLTVHDSLVIPERHAQHAATVLVDEIKVAIGLTPRVTIKHSAVGYCADTVA